MARVSSAKIIGGKRLRNLVKTLPENTRVEIASTIKRELDVIAGDARSRLKPRRNWLGDAAGEISAVAASIRVRVSQRTLRGRVTARVPIEVRKGSGIRKNLARLIELGTNPRHFGRVPRGPHPIEPAPFLFPAWKKRRPIARAAFNTAISRAVNKSKV